MGSSLPTRPGHTRQSPALALIAAIIITLTPNLVAAQADNAACYWPDGSSTGDGYLPCGNGDSEHSTCCSRGWTCLSNGLCMAAGQDPDNLAGATIVQGGCTDRTWNTQDCPNWCTDDDDIEDDELNRAQPIRSCPGSSDRFFCVLADDHDDCDESDEFFTFPGSLTIMTTIGVTPSPSSTAASSSSSSSESAASQTSGSESVSTSDPAASESTDPGTGDGGSGGPDPLAIGLGVGIGVGGLGIIVAVVFFLLWRRRGLKAKAAAAAADNEEGDGGEKGAAALSSSPESGVSELPTTLSKNVHEASPDAMIAEAPTGDQRVGRVEAPSNEKRFEVETAEGTQGRHELAGSEVPPQGAAAANNVEGQNANTSPTSASPGDASPQDCSTLGTSTLDASTLRDSMLNVSPVTATPTSPTNITRKPVA